MFLVVMVLVVVGVLISAGWGFAVLAPTESRCAACGYPTTGLNRETCPECGGSLAGEGTVAGHARVVRKAPRGMRWMARTVLAALLGVSGAAWVFAKYPEQWSTAWLRCGVASGSFTVLLDGSGTRYGRAGVQGYEGVARDRTFVTISGPARSISARILDTRLRVRWKDASGSTVRTTDMLTEDDVAHMIAASGVETVRPEEARAVYLAIRNMCADGEMPTPWTGAEFEPLRGASGNVSRESGANVKGLCGVAAGMVAVWLAMVWGLWRRGPAREGASRREADVPVV